MTADSTWQNSSFPGNFTVPPNGTSLWGPIPTDAGRSLQADIVACTVITFVIALIFVLLRFYTRGWLNRVLGASDWCIIPALLCAAGLTASSLEQMARGAGKHAWEVDIWQMSAYERAAWYGMLFYNLSLVFSRISILLLYKRIFTFAWIRRAIQVSLILVIATAIWFVVSVFTACIPLEAFWNWALFWTTMVYCQNGNVWWANAAIHIASDLVVMALPLPVLSSLKLPPRQKYALLGVFVLGFFVCLVSIIRLVTLIDVTRKPGFDTTYTGANTLFWTSIEVNTAITCACIMTLKPLIQRAFPRVLSPGRGSGSGTQSSHWFTPPMASNHNNTHRRGSLGPPHSFPPLSPTTSPGRRGSNCSAFKGNTGTFPLGYDFEKRRGSGGSGGIGNRHTAEYGILKPGDLDMDLDFDDDHLHHDRDHVRDRDVEAQRLSTNEGLGDSEEMPLGSLSPPPRAHRKLAIQVTRSVRIEEYYCSRNPGLEAQGLQRQSLDVGKEKDGMELDGVTVTVGTSTSSSSCGGPGNGSL